jgi:hypothetical protein
MGLMGSRPAVELDLSGLSGAGLGLAGFVTMNAVGAGDLRSVTGIVLAGLSLSYQSPNLPVVAAVAVSVRPAVILPQTVKQETNNGICERLLRIAANSCDGLLMGFK